MKENKIRLIVFSGRDPYIYTGNIIDETNEIITINDKKIGIIYLSKKYIIGRQIVKERGDLRESILNLKDYDPEKPYILEECKDLLVKSKKKPSSLNAKKLASFILREGNFTNDS